MTVPAAIVDRVRDATNIVDVIGATVELKKAGTNLKGLCPFHQEKTPSFVVSPSKQLYHCFGCGQGGNVFTFLMELEKLSFGEALERLAERAGIELPRVAAGAAGESDRVLAALEWARDFYRRVLDSRAGEPARAYLERRGLRPATIDAFGLGVAPDDWSALLDRAVKSFPAPVLEKAGLIIARPSGGGHYDRFRNRFMIPIVSPAGRTVAFGARALSDADQPKYLNSPETIVYRKGSALFGLPQARAGLRERGEMVLVEGYMDVMSLHEAGLAHAAGCCGTALTSDQVRMARRFVQKIVLLFDGDPAGVTAARRALGVVLAEGVSASVVLLPGGTDPDAFVRSHGSEAMERLLESRLDAVEFVETLQRLPASQMTVEDALHTLRDLLAVVPDAIARRLLVQKAAERFRFSETVLAEQVEAVRGKGAAGMARPAGRETGAEPAKPGPPRETGMPAGFEGNLLVDLILDPPLLTELGRRLLASRLSPPAKQAVEVLLTAGPGGAGEDLSRVVERVEDGAIRSLLTRASFSDPIERTDRERAKALADIVRWLESDPLLERKRYLEEQIRTTGDPQQVFSRELTAVMSELNARQSPKSGG